MKAHLLSELALIEKFLLLLEDDETVEPNAMPFPYDAVPCITTTDWSLKFVAEELIQNELREITNQLNHWQAHLRRWNAWNKTLENKEIEARWLAEWNWLEPTAFYCMFQPSATRDRFTLIATNALHQIRMQRNPRIKDIMLGDPTPEHPTPKHPSRTKKEKQLFEFTEPWQSAKKFRDALTKLDNDEYRSITSNFRNRASHAIAPRFTIGITSTITRSRMPAVKWEKQPDGISKEVTIPSKLSTCYAIGGTAPLDMSEAWKANLTQFEYASQTFDAYIELLSEAVKSLPEKSSAT